MSTSKKISYRVLVKKLTSFTNHCVAGLFISCFGKHDNLIFPLKFQASYVCKGKNKFIFYPYQFVSGLVVSEYCGTFLYTELNFILILVEHVRLNDGCESLINNGKRLISHNLDH